jgi:hypothetical protein
MSRSKEVIVEHDEPPKAFICSNPAIFGDPINAFEGMKLRGIPVWRAEFLHAINNADDVPENNFSTRSPTKSRQVEMWWIPGDGLLCFQHEKYFFVPSAQVRFVKFES